MLLFVDASSVRFAPMKDNEAVATTLTLDEVKRLHVESVLRACGGNQTEAARRLGINRKTVARLVRGEELVESME